MSNQSPTNNQPPTVGVILQELVQLAYLKGGGKTNESLLIAQSEAETAIMDWHKAEMRRVIGEDKPPIEVIGAHEYTKNRRIQIENELRAEQRQRGGL